MPDFAVMTAFKASDGVSSVFNRMGGAADRFGNRAGNAFEKASKGGFGMLSAVRGLLPLLTAGGIMEFANKSIEAWREQEAAVANVRAGLVSTKFAAGLTFDQLDEMATNLMKNSVFADENILQNITAQLLTFGGIGEQNFDRVQRAVLDVTSKIKGLKATGEDLNAMSIAMGKALENPAEGLNMLKRRGVMFDATQKQMIINLVASGQKLKAQNYMLSEIESKYGGSAKALSMTEAGQAMQRMNRINEMMEEIGRKLSPMKTTGAMFIEAILPTVIQLMEAIGNIFKMATPAIKGFGKTLEFIKPILPFLVYGFVLWKAAIWGVIIAKKVMLGLSWISYLWMMRSVIMGAVTRTALWIKAQWLLNAAMSANPIGLIIIGIAALIALIVLVVKHWNEWGAAMTVLMGPMGQVIAIFKAIYDGWDRIKKAFQDDGLLAGLRALGEVLLSGLLYPIQQLLELIEKLPLIGEAAGRGAAAIKEFRQGLNQPEAPNRAEVEGAQYNYSGRLDIFGVPQGSLFTQKSSGANPIKVNIMGTQTAGGY